MSEEHVDDFLEHFGVKGMKWGQRKNAGPKNTNVSARTQIKSAKALRDAKDNKLARTSAKAEERSMAVFQKVRSEKRAAGAGPIKAGKLALKDKRLIEADTKFAKAEDRLFYGQKANKAEYKQTVKEIRKSKNNWANKTTGERIVSIMLTEGTGPAAYKHIRATSNTSRGKATVTALWKGPKVLREAAAKG